MYQTIQELSKKYFEQTKQTRRDLHKYAEKGWLEIRTACIIAEELEALGFHVLVGEQIMKKEARMGLPSYQIMHLNYRRAQKEIKNSKYIEKVKDGMTAVAGVYKNGDGPVIGLRFDIDALGLIEESSQDHFPFQRALFFLPYWIYARMWTRWAYCNWIVCRKNTYGYQRSASWNDKTNFSTC